MAREAVVFPQELFGCTMKELYNIGGAFWPGCDISDGLVEEQAMEGEIGVGDGSGGSGRRVEQGRMASDAVHGSWDASCFSILQSLDDHWDVNSSSTLVPETGNVGEDAHLSRETATGRRKRRRAKSLKNKEEVENQRMRHIAIERNRRKQMNEYLAALQSFMPASYVQRGDQASIIGGAINYVRELEQLVQYLEAQKRIKQKEAPFANFFTFPQYSSISSSPCTATSTDDSGDDVDAAVAEDRSSPADIEVTMAESHANLKVTLRRRPKQLMKLVAGLESLMLTTLHLNVTTIDELVLYSFSVKVEDGCHLTTADDIATAVHHIVGKIIKEEAHACS